MGSELPEKEPESFFQRPFVRRWGSFLLKAIAIIVIVAVLSLLIPKMPAALMGITWAVLSVAAALGIAYPLVMKKTSKQVEFNGAGMLSRFNNGRFIRLIISFILGAVLMASLLFESQKWSSAQWAIILCSIPLYFFVTLCVEKALRKQYAPMFQTKGVILISGIIASLLMLVIYGVVVLLGNSVEPDSFLDAYIHTVQPFRDSSSSLLAELGKVTALGDAATELLIAETAKFSAPVAVAIRVVLCAGAFFGISSLLGLCSLNRSEITRIFQPLEAIGGSKEERPVLKRYLVLIIVLPVLLALGFVCLENKTEEVIATEEYSTAERIARSCVGTTATEINGSYYDTEQLTEFRAEAKLQSDTLASKAGSELKPLIAASFDARENNVDSYLDWYFDSVKYMNPSYEVIGTSEEYANEQFQTYIEQGIDDTELMERYGYYAEQANALKREMESSLSECQIEGLPDWLVIEPVHLESDFLSEGLASSQKISDAYNALVEGVPEENLINAIAIRVSDLASWQEFSEELKTEVDEAMKSHSSGLPSDAWVYLSHLPNSPLNRGTYEKEVKNCIEHERELLNDALPQE